MGAGLIDASGDAHGGHMTTSLTALYAGGVDELTTIGLALDTWAAVSGFTNLGMVADGGGGFGAADPSAQLSQTANDIRQSVPSTSKVPCARMCLAHSVPARNNEAAFIADWRILFSRAEVH